ncbi:hypothetical protein BMETH_587_0 [methanotrophic bacterial endosymbiont of Bathymodiolus sp.]|nr:hypothetical protein BMETH_587_0 [methanotrophic bacterial endosymbiont of Bathymodiolus sp.]
MKSLSILFSCCIVFICPLYWLIGRSAKFVLYMPRIIPFNFINRANLLWRCFYNTLKHKPVDAFGVGCSG